MTLPAPTYDLVLLLDAQAEDATRAKILADARASIQARGEIVRDDDWGERPLAYPIARRKSADYHLIQFHVSDKALLEGLDRTLRITDGVVRFRLIKLRPGTPNPPDMRSTAAPVRREEGEGIPATEGEPAGERAEAAPPAEATATSPEAEAAPAPAAAPPVETPAAETAAPEATAPDAAAPAATEPAPDGAEQPPAESAQPEPASGDAPAAE